MESIETLIEKINSGEIISADVACDGCEAECNASNARACPAFQVKYKEDIHIKVTE